MTHSELAICGERPITIEYDDYIIALFPRCIHLATHDAEELFEAFRKGESEDLIQKYIARLKEEMPVWKLPKDPFSQLIEYYGRPIYFSPIQFATMRLLILHNNGPVTLSKIALDGWGRYVIKSKVIKQIYTLNLLLKEENIPHRVKCKTERAFLVPVDHEKADSEVTSSDLVEDGLPT